MLGCIPGLDRDRTVYADLLFIDQRVDKIAHLSSGIRVQSECPLDAVGRGGIPFRRLETPVCKPGIRHMCGEKPRQLRVVQAGQPVDCFNFQCDGRRGMP